MFTMKSDKEALLSYLPGSVLEKSVDFKTSWVKKNEDRATAFIKSNLSSKDAAFLNKDMRWSFVLTKSDASLTKKKSERAVKNKKVNRLSSSLKKSIGLNKISKRGLKYEDFEPVHRCWQQYISEFLRVQDLEARRLRSIENDCWEELSNSIWRADFHGARLKVVASKCPEFVGIEGLVVFESKNTYRILGTDNVTRCVPKQSCEFAFNVGPYELSFLGKNLTVKPTERANKKTKNFSFGLI